MAACDLRVSINSGGARRAARDLAAALSALSPGAAVVLPKGARVRVLVVPDARSQRKRGLRAMLRTVADGRHPRVAAIVARYLASNGAGSYWTKAGGE